MIHPRLLCMLYACRTKGPVLLVLYLYQYMYEVCRVSAYTCLCLMLNIGRDFRYSQGQLCSPEGLPQVA